MSELRRSPLSTGMRLREQGYARAKELSIEVPSEALIATLGLSDFAWSVLLRHPDWIRTLEIPPGLDAVVGAPSSEAIAIFRIRRAVSQIALELSGQLSVRDSLAYASDTACACIQAALDLAAQEHVQRFGQALDQQQQAQQLIVFGMGKLGGHELNFSSDIDLICCYPDNGESSGPKVLDNQDYFSRVTRRCAQILGELTPAGSAYRVDLRLRPFGQAGQYALSFAAMEDYYQREGRDWERYAWIKAAPVAGDIARGAQLKARLRPFVYRRYLDFAAFEGLREMKLLVDQQVRRSGHERNIKLGPGGIREVEFLVQLEQLIRGGREPKLQLTGTLPALATLQQIGVLSEHETTQLESHYLFLRALENRVQMLADQQTHDVPDDADQRLLIAESLGYLDWPTLELRLQDVRAQVQQFFLRAIEADKRVSTAYPNGEPVKPAHASVAEEGDDFALAKLFWQNLNSAQFSETKPEAISLVLWQKLVGFAQSSAVQGMSARGKNRLDQVVPLLWSLATREPDPEPCAMRLIDFLSAILGRSAYLALLAEKPAVAKRLVQWFSQSAWIARTLTQTPILLDELLDSRRGREALNAGFERAREVLLAEFSPQLSAQRQLDGGDTEALFELLVTLKNTVQLRVASQFLAGQLDAYRATQWMSATADVILALVLEHALDEMQRQHGELVPLQSDANLRWLPGFCVVGYGSLGGEEINFASDLDLVFLFASQLASRESSGAKPLDGQRYCVKLAQRVLSLLSMNTRFGPLYAIDTRLRPNGNKGLLVTSLDAFADYQRKEAWTWEHQALVRARAVAGDPELSQVFQQLRAEVLTAERDHDVLQSEVRNMRERMRAELDRSNDSQFDLKQGQGGLVDIEFALQTAMLAGTLSPALGTRSVDLLASNPAFAALATTHARYLDLSLRATLALAPRVVPSSLREFKQT